MDKDFVTFNQAVELKKLLYGEHYGNDYFAWYSSNKDFHFRNMNSPVYPNNQSFIAPLKQQVFRWFREKYKIRFIIQSSMSDLGEYFKLIFPNGETRSVAYPTYEEAENACIDKLIEILKQQDK
jgi:hypothetical protein